MLLNDDLNVSFLHYIQDIQSYFEIKNECTLFPRNYFFNSISIYEQMSNTKKFYWKRENSQKSYLPKLKLVKSFDIFYL